MPTIIPGQQLGTPGQPNPSVAVQNGGTDGTNLRVFSTDTTGRLNVIVGNSSLAVTGAFYQATQPVSGAFWQATQPVSASTLPLPSGASTAANQATIAATLASIQAATGQGIASQKAAAGAEFMATTPVFNLGAGASNVLALANPTGSGKTLYVSRVAFSSAIAGMIQRSRVLGGTFGGTAYTPLKRLPTGPTASVASVFVGTVTATGGTSTIEATRSTNGLTSIEEAGGDVIVPPGYALVFSATAWLASLVNLNVSATLDLAWWEA